jgi:cytochrome c oxidase cbb3-type subunit 3
VKRLKNVFLVALSGTMIVAAQSPPPSSAPPQRRYGGLVPGQQRPPGDPAQIARGKTLYEVSCRGCHGADLRGGDMGGPNLLRSQVALSDKDGELIVPIIQGSRQNSGMPPIPMSPQDGKAVAAYVRSIIATIGRQGMPPSIGKAAPSVLVGDASAGQAYFAAKCAGCHSATGDLAGIGAKFSDPKALQNRWVSGGESGRRFGPVGTPDQRRAATVTVKMPSGETLDGRLIRIDDFLVTVGLADGSIRTVHRQGDVPKVEVHDPMQAHRDLLAVYTDKDIHDVTAYLVTLK